MLATVGIRTALRGAGTVLVVCTLAWGVEPSGVDALRELVARGQYAEAESLARDEFDRLERSGDERGAVTVLDVLVEAMWRGGKPRDPETHRLARSAVERKTALLGEDDPALAESLNNLAVVLFFDGDYRGARPLWERALTLREAALGPDHPDVARSLNSLANLLQTIGDYAGARTMYERAVAVREKALGPEHATVAQSLSNLAVLLRNAGDFAGALPLAERAVAIREKTLGADHPRVGLSLTVLANVLTEMGDYHEAATLFERSQTIFERSLGEDHRLVATALNNRAWVLRKMEEFAAARPLYERALATWQEALGPESRDVGACLHNLAELSVRTGDLDRADELYGRALAVREAAVGSSHPDVAETLGGRAELLSGVGRYDDALPLLERAVALRSFSLGSEHPSVGTSMGGLARLLATTGRAGTALVTALDAERISRDHLRLTGRSLSEQQALRYSAVRDRGLDLALTLAAAGLDGDARRLVLDAVARSRAVVLDEMARRQRTVSAAGDPQIARLAERVADARSRLANLTVRGVGDEDPERYRRMLDEVRREKQLAERELAGASVTFAREQEQIRVGFDEVRASLPANTVLISFVQYLPADLQPIEPPAADAPPLSRGDLESAAPAYLAFVLHHGRPAPHVIDLGPAGPVDDAISAWKAEAAGGVPRAGRTAAEAEARYREAGADLRVLVWDRLEAVLDGAERVFLVPDGALNLVNFAALPDAGGYLVESGPRLHYLSAERDLVSHTAEPAGSGLLVLGGPDYDDGERTSGRHGASPAWARLVRDVAPRVATRGARAGCGSFETLRFAPLPGAEREGREIVSLWSGMTRAGDTGPADVVHLTGGTASEAAFKRDAPGKRVLHLATHGFFLGGPCATDPPADAEAALGRGLKVVTLPPPSSIEGVSPLLLSGLALAGANRRTGTATGGEDGILTAEELSGLDLSGVEWAVLSACDTGVGEIQAGEGVFGLRRAIQVAGVRTLVMSLWPVDDEATRRFMRALYESRWRDGLDTVDALAAAALRVLHRRRDDGESTHPFYWAAFVAAGDWR